MTGTKVVDGNEAVEARFVAGMEAAQSRNPLSEVTGPTVDRTNEAPKEVSVTPYSQVLANIGRTGKDAA